MPEGSEPNGGQITSIEHHEHVLIIAGNQIAELVRLDACRVQAGAHRATLSQSADERTC